MRVLFICTGNTCRSPIAEALLKQKYPEQEVQSAGIYANSGDVANSNAIKVLKKRNINLVHSSQMVTEDLLAWSDIVFTMTVGHKHLLQSHFPKYEGKYHVLKEYISKNIHNISKESYGTIDGDYKGLCKNNESLLLSGFDIKDPYGQSIEVYEETTIELEKYINQLKKVLFKEG